MKADINKPEIKKISVLLVGHVTESYGPMQALPKYLAKNFTDFAVIAHPFSYSGIPKSTAKIYKNSQERKVFNGPKYKTIEAVHFFGDILLTLYFLVRLKKRWNLYIGSDCLNVFTGVFLRSLGVVKKVVFYEYDFTPDRLKNKTLNKIFHYFNGFAARHADVVWDNPPNLSEIRKEQGSDLKKVFRVPHAVDLDKVHIPPENKIDRFCLVYVGHVTESKGLQLVVSAVSDLIKKTPKIKVAIVGSGPYEPTLKELVKKEKLEKNFVFYGYTQHDWTLSYLPSCGIALAPYVNEDRGTFRFAEPLKVKDYLGCGLPIIITRVPDIAKEIDQKKLGLAIEYDKNDLKKAIEKLLTDKKFYSDCRKNVLSYAANITWDHTFDLAFQKTFEITGISH